MSVSLLQLGIWALCLLNAFAALLWFATNHPTYERLAALLNALAFGVSLLLARRAAAEKRKAMPKNQFRQTLVLAVVSGVFILGAAHVIATYGSTSDRKALETRTATLDNFLLAAEEKNNTLEEKLRGAVSSQEYEALRENHDKLVQTYERLPACLGTTPEERVSRACLLAKKVESYECRLCVVFEFLRDAVTKRRAINTNSPPTTDLRIVYSAIQIVLNSLGIPQSTFDGNQHETCESVKHFQEMCGIKIDGIVGTDTWIQMERHYGELGSNTKG